VTCGPVRGLRAGESWGTMVGSRLPVRPCDVVRGRGYTLSALIRYKKNEGEKPLTRLYPTRMLVSHRSMSTAPLRRLQCYAMTRRQSRGKLLTAPDYAFRRGKTHSSGKDFPAPPTTIAANSCSSATDARRTPSCSSGPIGVRKTATRVPGRSHSGRVRTARNYYGGRPSVATACSGACTLRAKRSSSIAVGRRSRAGACGRANIHARDYVGSPYCAAGKSA